MRIFPSFLVIVLASSYTHAAKPSSNRFPDFLAPFRSMFGRPSSSNPHHNQPPVHMAQPVEPVRIYQSPKDSAGAETSKPFGGGEQGFEEGGFRPFFPGVYTDSPSAGGQEEPQFLPQQPQFSPQGQGRPQFPRGQHFRPPRPGSANRPLRQEIGASNDFSRPFEGESEQGQPPRQGGFTDFSFTAPDFNQGFEQQPAHSPAVSSNAPEPVLRPHRFPGGGRPGAGPRPFHGHGQGGPRPSHDFNSGPSHHQAQSHGYGQVRPSIHANGGERFAPEEYTVETFEHRPRGGSREPQIITLEDIQKPNSIDGSNTGSAQYFDQIYRQSNPQPGPPPHLSGQAAYTRQVPSFAQPNSGSGHGSGHRNPVVFQSQPLRSPAGSMRPFSGSQAYPSSDGDESEDGQYFQESKPTKQIAFRPSRVVRRPTDNTAQQSTTSASSSSSTSSGEDVTYGRPMVMSASSSRPTMVDKKGRPPKKSHHRHNHPLVLPHPLPQPTQASAIGKPVLLHSPKIPNLAKSHSFQSPVTAPYEPVQAASGHGGGGFTAGGGGGFGAGGGGGDIGATSSNGDRILYHVAGHQGPYSYRFGYDTGKGYNRMFRHEEKDGTGYVKGKYGFYDEHGKLQLVNYEAHPKHGFHAERGHAPSHSHASGH